MRDAEKYRASMEPKTRRKARARRGGLCQQRIMTRDVRHVVTSITVITAKPAMEIRTGKQEIGMMQIIKDGYGKIFKYLIN